LEFGKRKKSKQEDRRWTIKQEEKSFNILKFAREWFLRNNCLAIVKRENGRNLRMYSICTWYK
jgi:hypothetical protein